MKVKPGTIDEMFHKIAIYLFTSTALFISSPMSPVISANNNEVLCKLAILLLCSGLILMSLTSLAIHYHGISFINVI